jgi:hypothetical protein
MKFIVAIVAIIIVVVAAFLGVWLFSRPGGGYNSWVFKGAYANYEGQTTMAGLNYNMSMTIHEEVLDFNSTYAEMLTSATMDMGFGTPYTYNYTSWVNITQYDTFNFTGGNLTSSYDTTVTLGKLGTRNCIAYEYSTMGETMTIYVDKTVNFPVEFSVASGSYNFDITLVSTNIPGL